MPPKKKSVENPVENPVEDNNPAKKPDGYRFGDGKTPKNLSSISSHGDTFQSQQDLNNPELQRRILQEAIDREEQEQERARIATMDDALSASNTPKAVRTPSDSGNVNTIKSNIDEVTGKTNTLIAKLSAATTQLAELKDKISREETKTVELEAQSTRLNEQTDTLTSELASTKSQLLATVVQLEASKELLTQSADSADTISQKVALYEAELNEILGKTVALRKLFDEGIIPDFINANGGRSNRRSQRRNRRKTNQTNQSRKRKIRSLRRKY
jgi:hypothetical protein